MCNLRSLLLVTGLLFMTDVAAAQRLEVPSFIPLGELPGASYYSDALDVARGGSVVVGNSLSHLGPPGEAEAFRWTPATGIVGLGYPVPGYTVATGVSADGTVIVGFESRGSLGWQAFRWTEYEGRVALSGAPIGFSSFAQDVSADGDVVAGYFYGQGGFSAFRWTAATGFVPLLSFVESAAIGISADGNTIIGYTINDGIGFRWTEETGAVAFGEIPRGFQYHIPAAISADGSAVVGGLFIGPPDQHCGAYRWMAVEGFKLLGDALETRRSCHHATAVSADGAIVGGADEVIDDAGITVGVEAFIWTERKGMARLQDILAANTALDLRGWTLTSVNSISSNQNSVAIVGGGINPLGNYEGWLARLPPVREVEIDIKPEGPLNQINARSSGKIPVALLSTAQFDVVARMDRTSIRFGRTGKENSLAFCDDKSVDVNGDKLKDLICHFEAVSTDFACTDREGVMTGETKDGNPLAGVMGRARVEIKCR
jgi:uncharacterized membrane protein